MASINVAGGFTLEDEEKNAEMSDIVGRHLEFIEGGIEEDSYAMFLYNSEDENMLGDLPDVASKDAVEAAARELFALPYVVHVNWDGGDLERRGHG